jgi:microcystin-dependent protein
MECYLGEIRAFAGNYAPEDWAICNGSLLRINDYQVLYALLGTTYGGDGVTTFALPDLRGRIVVNRGTAVSGTTYVPGGAGGVETVAINSSTMPAHNHAFNVSTDNATTNVPQNNMMAETMDPGSGNVIGAFLPATAPDTTTYPLQSNAIGPLNTAGMGHENRMPYLAINYIIHVVNGIYPSFD